LCAAGFEHASRWYNPRMRGHVCPWWFGYFLLSPLRRWLDPPSRLLAPLVREGMLVLEPGCGMGYYTLDLARLVGPSGRVVAIDLQERMLAGLRRRARRAGLLERIETRLVGQTQLGIDDLAGRVDLMLAIYMVHELIEVRSFFAEARRALKPGGRLLFVEPRAHVSRREFEASLETALGEGFRRADGPLPGRTLQVLLEVPTDPASGP